jgi:DNA invertase Pin-like site-specific DNA recombinase
MTPERNDDMATTRLAAIYARISTEEQAKGLVPSTGIQVEKCKAKAADLVILVAEDASLIVEEQHSGADLRWDGTKFMSLVRRAERGEFTDLICLNMSRFCRAGVGAYFEQKSYFTSAGVTIHYVQDEVAPDMPFHNTVEALKADAAQFQLDETRRLSIGTRVEWAKQGNIVIGNTPPFGFQPVEDETRRTKRNRPVVVRLDPDPVTGPVLLHMTEHVANGGAVGALKRWLEAEGVRTPKGAAVWHTATIRRILHNPTNYGGRRSHVRHVVERENSARRAASLKTKHTVVPVPEAEQYPVDPARITPIPGLTYDLWRRAIDQLGENKQYSPRGASLSDEERAQRGLLFGGRVRCVVCRGGLRVKHNEYGWIYVCYHTGTAHEGETCISIPAKALDRAVWGLAVTAIRDPSLFERIVTKMDEVGGPQVRVANLRVQRADAQREYDRVSGQLDRLDPDDDLVPDYQAKLRQKKATVATLTDALAAAERDAASEQARRATLAAFHTYAATQRDTLDRKTPYERHVMLRALHTRVRLGHAADPDRVRIVFDVRHLPGASEWLAPDVSEEPDGWFDLSGGLLWQGSLAVLQTDGSSDGLFTPLAPLPIYDPQDPAERAAYLSYLADIGATEDLAAYLADDDARREIGTPHARATDDADGSPPEAGTVGPDARLRS